MKIIYFTQLAPFSVWYKFIQCFVKHSVLNKRHLYCKYSAIVQLLHQLWKKGFMIRNPVQTGIGKNQVIITDTVKFIRNRTFPEFQIRICFVCFAQHIIWTVNSKYISIGKKYRKLICAVARTTTYIKYWLRKNIYSAYQVNWRLYTLVFKLCILVWVPVIHLITPL